MLLRAIESVHSTVVFRTIPGPMILAKPTLLVPPQQSGWCNLFVCGPVIS